MNRLFPWEHLFSIVHKMNLGKESNCEDLQKQTQEKQQQLQGMYCVT